MKQLYGQHTTVLKVLASERNYIITDMSMCRPPERKPDILLKSPKLAAMVSTINIRRHY